MTRGWPVLVAAAFVVSVGACGGGDGSLTRAEYTREANHICRAAAAQVRTVKPPDPADPAAVARAGAHVVAIQRRALVRLRGLRPPDADEPQLVRWVALVDQTLDQADASVAAQRKDDAGAAITANQHGAMLDARADQIARRYGLTSCGAATAAGGGS